MLLLNLKWDNLENEQQKIRDVLQFHGIIIHDMSIHYFKDENRAEINYTAKTPDKMNAIQIAADLNEKIEGLKDFSICDK